MVVLFRPLVLLMETSLPSGGGLTFHGAASTDRDDSDDGSSAVDFRLECDLCTAGVEAPVVLFASFLHAFGCLSVVVFFFVFHRAQR
jgi:hypothetical protein